MQDTKVKRIVSAFCKDVRKARQDRQLSRAQVANMAGLSDITVRNVESAKFVPSLSTAIKLSECLNVELRC